MTETPTHDAVPMIARNAAWLAMATRFPNSDLIHSVEFSSALKAALDAAAPHMMAEAFEQGQKSGMRHADRLVAAAKIGRPDLPGPLSHNPYRSNQ